MMAAAGSFPWLPALLPEHHAPMGKARIAEAEAKA